MNVSEAAKLLTKCAAYDNRHPSREAAMAWAEAMTMRSISLDEASRALTQHYVSSTDYCQPAHVIRIAQENRKSLALIAGPPDYPPELSWREEQAWRRDWRESIECGRTNEDATAFADRQWGYERPATAELSAHPIQQLISGIVKAAKT